MEGPAAAARRGDLTRIPWPDGADALVASRRLPGLASRIASDVSLVTLWGRRELRVRYRSTRLGLIWALAQPLALLAVFGFVFRRFLHVGSGGLPYISFAYAGLVPWTFATSALAASVTSLVNAKDMVTGAYFHRELVPLGAVAASGPDLAIAVVLLLVIVAIQGVGLSIHLIALPLVFVVLLLWTSAAAIFLATATAFIRDIRLMLPLTLQLLFVASPIMYPKSLLPASFHWLSVVNPVAVLVQGMRDCVLLHVWPAWGLLAAQGLVALGFLVLAIVYTRSVKMRMADVL